MDTATLRVVTVAARSGRQVLRVRAFGEVDLASAPVLGTALAAAAECGPDEVEIEVDLAEVTFFDCAGLKALERSERATGGRLRLVATSKAVRLILHTFGMQHRFDAPRPA